MTCHNHGEWVQWIHWIHWFGGAWFSWGSPLLCGSINHPIVLRANNRMTLKFWKVPAFIEKCQLPAPYWLMIGQFDLAEVTDWLIGDPKTRSGCLQASFCP